MQVISYIVLAVYAATPLFLAYRWVRLAGAGLPLWPMPAAIGLWLLQAAVLAYAILGCISGHCNPTALEQAGPVVLLVVAYLGIGWLLWFSRARAT